MSFEDEAADGVTLAGDMMAAFGRGDETEYLRLVNEAGHVEVRYAAAYLVGWVFVALTDAAGGDEAKARALMCDCAEGVAADAVSTAVAQILSDARRNEAV